MAASRRGTGVKTTRREALAAAGALACVVAVPGAARADGAPESKVVIVVSGGMVQEVYADDAEVYVIDFDAEGAEDWSVGGFATTPLSELDADLTKERQENAEVDAVIREVTGG